MSFTDHQKRLSMTAQQLIAAPEHLRRGEAAENIPVALHRMWFDGLDYSIQLGVGRAGKHLWRLVQWRLDGASTPGAELALYELRGALAKDLDEHLGRTTSLLMQATLPRLANPEPSLWYALFFQLARNPSLDEAGLQTLGELLTELLAALQQIERPVDFAPARSAEGNA